MFTKISELLAATTLLAQVEVAPVDIPEYLSGEDIKAVEIVQRDLSEHGISTNILVSEHFNDSSCSVFLEVPAGLSQEEGVRMSAFTIGIDDNFDGVLERTITDEICLSVSGKLIHATLKADKPFNFPFD